MFASFSLGILRVETGFGEPVVSSRVCAVIFDEAHCVSKW